MYNFEVGMVKVSTLWNVRLIINVMLHMLGRTHSLAINGGVFIVR